MPSPGTVRPAPLFLRNPASQLTILSLGTLVLDSLSPLPTLLHLSPQPQWDLLGPWPAASKASEPLEVHQISNWKRKAHRSPVSIPFQFFNSKMCVYTAKSFYDHICIMRALNEQTQEGRTQAEGWGSICFCLETTLPRGLVSAH